MKFNKAKRFNTVESYATCICAWSTCYCSCGVCVCGCNGYQQPLADDRNEGRSDANNYNATADSMSNTSSQSLQL